MIEFLERGHLTTASDNRVEISLGIPGIESQLTILHQICVISSIKSATINLNNILNFLIPI
jgi:hypothetical protein